MEMRNKKIKGKDEKDYKES